MLYEHQFEKFWSGGVSFQAVETFSTLDAAVRLSVPSNAAKIIIDEKTLSYDFKRIKEVDNSDANALQKLEEQIQRRNL